MKIILRITSLFLSTLLFSSTVHSQKFTLRSYNIGYRVFEISAIGNNPNTVGRFLKDPIAYQNFINTIEHNGTMGNPEIHRLRTYYIGAEFHGPSERSRFWRKYTFQTGLLLTNKISTSAGALTHEWYTLGQDTIIYNNNYSLEKNQQFIGALAGINRRFTISKKFRALIGLHYQGSFAFIHNYEQRLDSSTYVLNGARKTSSTDLPNLKGRNFYQWQAMIPLGIEYVVYQNKFSLRLEGDFGIVVSRYRSKNFAAMETHGAGLSFIYRPENKSEVIRNKRN